MEMCRVCFLGVVVVDILRRWNSGWEIGCIMVVAVWLMTIRVGMLPIMFPVLMASLIRMRMCSIWMMHVIMLKTAVCMTMCMIPIRVHFLVRGGCSHQHYVCDRAQCWVQG